MEPIMAFLIFVTVLIIYLHVMFHTKTCSDLEIFEIDETVSKSKFEDILNMRQPVVFDFFNEFIFNINESLFSKHPNLEVCVHKCIDEDIILTPVHAKKAVNLFKSNERYISEGNEKFIVDSKTNMDITGNDGYLRPFMCSSSSYDFITGNKGATTVLKHETHFRNFFVVTSGRVHIKLIPPAYKDFLSHEDDYEFYLFYSKANPWMIQDEYKEQFSRAKSIDVILVKGQILYIPPYWYHSTKLEEDSTFVVSMKYNTIMNEVATMPGKVLYFLQRQNLTYKVAREKKEDKIDSLEEEVKTR
jgi:hypothetical protein